ncbi:hypothetical protein BT69DRAFT_1332666 [Atractiella rhizophila]|nr:hypothetical protein BT69DRAFT_1332666 [Atractiella rhizophila]
MQSSPTPTTSTSTASSLLFPAGGQAEIIRAHQKDMYYAKEVEHRLESILMALFGSRWVRKWDDEIEAFSRAIYYGLTTIDGTQTLGEEYCDIVQFNSRTQTLPTRVLRSVVVLTHSLTPLFVEKFLPYLRKRRLEARAASSLEHEPSGHEKAQVVFSPTLVRSPTQLSSRATRIKELVSEYLRTLKDLFWTLDTKTIVEQIARPMHLALFYLFGKYFHFSKRLWGSPTFIATQARLPTDYIPSYELLGFLLSIQLSLRLILTIRARRTGEISSETGKLEKDPVVESDRKALTVDGLPVRDKVLDTKNPSPADDDEVDGEPPQKRCTLCLGRKRDPTLTECGHVYCWECIVGWAREKTGDRVQ